MGENDGKEKRPEAAMVMLPQEIPEGMGERHLRTRSEERNQVHEPYDEQPAKEDHVYDECDGKRRKRLSALVKGDHLWLSVTEAAERRTGKG